MRDRLVHACPCAGMRESIVFCYFECQSCHPSRSGLSLKPNLRERERPVIADRYTRSGQRSPPLSRVCGSGCGVAAWRARTFAKTESEIIVSLSARACVYFVLYLTSALHAPRPHTPLREDLAEKRYKYVIALLPYPKVHGTWTWSTSWTWHICACACACACAYACTCSLDGSCAATRDARETAACTVHTHASMRGSGSRALSRDGNSRTPRAPEARRHAMSHARLRATEREAAWQVAENLVHLCACLGELSASQGEVVPRLHTR